MTTPGGTNAADSLYTYVPPQGVALSLGFSPNPLPVGSSGVLTLSFSNTNATPAANINTILNFNSTVTVLDAGAAWWNLLRVRLKQALRLPV